MCSYVKALLMGVDKVNHKCTERCFIKAISIPFSDPLLNVRIIKLNAFKRLQQIVNDIKVQSSRKPVIVSLLASKIG